MVAWGSSLFPSDLPLRFSLETCALDLLLHQST